MPYQFRRIYNKSRRRTHWVAWVLLLLQLPSFAQVLPPSLAPNPGQIERQLAPEPQPRAKPGTITIPMPDQTPAPVADDVRFTLSSVRIVGATRISEDALKPLYSPLLGSSIGFNDLNELTRRMTAYYRNAGYLLSQAILPPQAIDNGEVSIRIIEGYVEGFELRGVDPGEFPLIETYARQITEAKPIDAATLEQNLLLMNDLPGISVRGTLLPAKDNSGAAKLVLEVSRLRFAGGISYDNRGGNSLGPSRLMMDAQATSLLRANDRTLIRGVTSGDSKLNFLSLGHEQMIGSSGGKLGFFANSVRSQPKERFFIPLKQQTESQSYSLQYTQPLIRRRAENLAIRTTLGSYDGQTSLFDVVETRDAIRSWRLGMTYDLADAWGGVNLVDVEYSQGIPGLGASSNNDPMLSRATGRVDYRKLNVYLARVQILGAGWSILGAASAQHAYTDLLASELYSLGGEPFGRGFDPSELVGDHGLAGKIELRYNLALPDLGIQNAMIYGFQEAGHVRQRTPLAGTDAKESLASHGLGLRLQVAPQLAGFVEVAKPRLRDVATENNQNARIFAGISMRF